MAGRLYTTVVLAAAIASSAHGASFFSDLSREIGGSFLRCFAKCGTCGGTNGRQAVHYGGIGGGDRFVRPWRLFFFRSEPGNRRKLPEVLCEVRDMRRDKWQAGCTLRWYWRRRSLRPPMAPLFFPI